MATIRQVAAHANVSIGTVSKVLNGQDEKVDPELRRRIWESIRALRYRPPAFERNQKAVVSHNVGLIVPDLTERPLLRHGYVHLILDGVLEVASLRGWSVTIFADKMWDEGGNVVRRKYDGRCDCLVVVAPQPDRDLVPLLQQRGAPIVQIGTTAWLEGVSSVDLDNVKAGRLVGDHLAGLGHRRVMFLTTEREQVSSRERWQGLSSTPKLEVVRIAQGREETSAELALRIADMDHPPTAIMGWNDGIVIPLIGALRGAGIEVPYQISVAGVDGSQEAPDQGIPLTTIANPLGDLGRRAAAMAIDRALEPSLPAEQVMVEPKLIVGKTTTKAMK